MIKLIVSDLDGTLLQKGEKRISAEVENAIKATINKGVNVAIITGRSYLDARAVMPMDIRGLYYYCCGGAVGIRDGKTLYSKPVSAENVILALKTARAKGIAVMLSGDTEAYLYGDSESRFDALCTEHGGADRITCMTQVKRPIYKISFLGLGDGKVFEHDPIGLRLWYRRGGIEEYVNRFVGKAQALSDLMMRESVLAGEVVAAGNDALDDFEMLKKAGKGYAFESDLAEESGAILTRRPLDVFEI